MYHAGLYAGREAECHDDIDTQISVTFTMIWRSGVGVQWGSREVHDSMTIFVIHDIRNSTSTKQQ